MSPQPDIADGLQAEQTWRQLQLELKLKNEFLIFSSICHLEVFSYLLQSKIILRS